jgi:translation elongation factor EF-4
VINKIDAGAADVPATEDQLMSQLDFDPEEMRYISAKTGQGVDTVFKAIIESLPPPPAPENEILKAFLFDARFVPTRGVACLIKVMSGCLTVEKVKQPITELCSQISCQRALSRQAKLAISSAI